MIKQENNLKTIKAIKMYNFKVVRTTSWIGFLILCCLIFSYFVNLMLLTPYSDLSTEAIEERIEFRKSLFELNILTTLMFIVTYYIGKACVYKVIIEEDEDIEFKYDKFELSFMGWAVIFYPISAFFYTLFSDKTFNREKGQNSFLYKQIKHYIDKKKFRKHKN